MISQKTTWEDQSCQVDWDRNQVTTLVTQTSRVAGNNLNLQLPLKDHFLELLFILASFRPIHHQQWNVWSQGNSEFGSPSDSSHPKPDGRMEFQNALLKTNYVKEIEMIHP